jgi:hypothetical protein
MDSSKISLKEGFNFLFEEETGAQSEQTKRKKRKSITLDSRFSQIATPIDLNARDAVAAFVLCDIVFSGIDNEEPLLFRKYKSLDNEDETGGSGKKIKISSIIRDLKLLNHKILFKDYKDKVSASGQQKLKILAKLYAFSAVALRKAKKKTIILESEDVGIKYSSYKNLLIRLTPFINQDVINVNKIADLVKSLVDGNQLISSGFDDVNFEDNNVENKNVTNSIDDFFKSYLEAYMKPDNFNKRSTTLFNSKDEEGKKEYLKRRKKSFWTNTFGGVNKYNKILTAISNNKFDLVKFILRGLSYRKGSSNILDAKIGELYKILFSKNVSKDDLTKIFNIASKYAKAMLLPGADKTEGSSDYTSAYNEIKHILESSSVNILGNSLDSQSEEEAESEIVDIEIEQPVAAAETEEEEEESDKEDLSEPFKEAGEEAEEKGDKDEVDHIIFDSFHSNAFGESNPIINGISVIALNLKYDSSFNIPAMSDYNEFKKISLQSLKYLCDNGHLKDNADKNISFLIAARRFTKISAEYNSDIGKIILAENVSQDTKLNIKISKSNLNKFVNEIPSDLDNMSSICNFLQIFNHTDKVFDSYFNHDQMGTILTSVQLKEIVANINSGKATLDTGNAQLSNENTTAVVKITLADGTTVVQMDYNELTSEVELTAANGDSATIPVAPEMSAVSGADTIVTQLIDDTAFDTTLSDDTQVDAESNRASYEAAHQNKDSIIESITSSKEFNNIRANFVSGESKTSFESNLKEVLTGDIINNIKSGKDIAIIQVPLSKMMMNYQISTGPIKSIMKNILKKDEEDLSAIVKLSMFGSTKKLYQNQFDLQLSNVVRAAFEQNVYGNTSFEVSESLLREGFLTGIKNLSSDLAQGLKNLWAGKDAVEKVKMVTAFGGLVATGFSAAPVAAGLYTVSAALGLGRRFAKEVPKEKAARKDWFPEGQTILKMILEDKESDKFIASLVKTNIINTIIKLINPEYKFHSLTANPKKLQPIVEEFVEQKETYKALTDDQKNLFKEYSKRVHEIISDLPWADYGGNSQHGEFAIVSPMHINRLINRLFLTEGGIKFLNYTTFQEGHKEENRQVESEIYDKLYKYLDEINISKIYASRLRQVVKKRSSLVKGNISNWFKDRVSPKWKTTVYAEFSSKIVKEVLNVDQSFMPKKSSSLKDKVGAYASSLGKERSDENYLGYSLEELLFENIIFENSNIFFDEEEKAKTREEIDDESVRDTESTAEDLLTGISPSISFLTMQLEKENLYQSLVVRDYLPYTTTELKTQVTQARDYVDSAQEAVKLQSSMPKQDFVNRWYELEPNDAGEGQEIISWWYSTKKYAGTPKQLHLAYRNTTTGEIKMIGGAEEADDFGWSEVLEENGLKIDGTNGVVELPNCDAKLVDLNDDSVISEFMTDLKSNLVGSYHEQILKTSEPMTVEEYIDKTQEKFTGSESGLHLVLPNDKSPDMLEKIALTSAKNEQFMLMKIKAGMKAGKLTGEVPPELLSGTKKGLVEFNLSEKMLKKAGINEKTLDKFEEYRYRLEQARIDYMQSEGEGPVSLERMFVQAYRETVGTLPVEQKEELVSAIVKVKGEAANAGLNLAVNNVSHEEVVEIEVTKYKEIEREIQIPLDKSSELGRALEKFYNFSSILRTANMVTSIGTLLWKRGIDHALFQKHFMENIRLDDAIISDIVSVIVGYEPIFTNSSTTYNGQSIVSDMYENPATSDIQSAAEDVVTSGVRENNLVYETDLSSYLFENKLVTKSRKSSKISNNNVSYSEEINEHNELKDLFKKLF